MAIDRNLSASDKQARNEMADAAKHGETKRDFEEELLDRTGDEKFARTYKRRGKLYDKLHVSVRTMDVIIVVICILIVLAIVFGILIGK